MCEAEGLARLDFKTRLMRLLLFSICGHFHQTDLIKIWKAFNSDIDVRLLGLFERQLHRATRGHGHGLYS